MDGMRCFFIIVLAVCFFVFAVVQANKAVRKTLSSNAPAHTKLLLIMVALATCFIPYFWGLAADLIDDHLKKKGYR